MQTFVPMFPQQGSKYMEETNCKLYVSDKMCDPFFNRTLGGIYMPKSSHIGTSIWKSTPAPLRKKPHLLSTLSLVQSIIYSSHFMNV